MIAAPTAEAYIAASYRLSVLASHELKPPLNVQLSLSVKANEVIWVSHSRGQANKSAKEDSSVPYCWRRRVFRSAGV